MLVTTVSRTQAGNCMQVGTTRFVIAISFVYVRGLLFLELFRFPNVPVVVWGTNLASLQTEVESLPENYSIAIFSKCSRRERLSPMLFLIKWSGLEAWTPDVRLGYRSRNVVAGRLSPGAIIALPVLLFVGCSLVGKDAIHRSTPSARAA